MSYPVRKLRKRKNVRRNHDVLIRRSEGVGHHMKGIVGHRQRGRAITPRAARDPEYAKRKVERLNERHARRVRFARSARALREYRGES